MLKIRNIASKLALLMHLFIFIFVVYFAYMHYTKNLKTAHKEVLSNLSLEANIQKASLEKYFTTVESEILFLAQTGTLKLGLDTFKTTWAELGTKASTILRQAYVEKNKFEDKSKLISSDLNNTYDILHEAMHAYLYELKLLRKYHDILLLDTQGNIIYSVQKFDNYAKNIQDSSKNLQEVFQEINTNLGKEFVAFRNCTKEDKSFIATAVVDEVGDKIGLLVFSLNPDTFKKYDITKVIQQKEVTKADKNSTHFLAHSHFSFKANHWDIKTSALSKKIDEPIKQELYDLLKVFFVLSLLALALSYLVMEKLLDRKDEDE